MMKDFKMKQARAFVLLICVLLLSGCLGRTPAPKFYLLTPLEGVAGSSAGTGMTLGVGPVTIPEYLKRPQIVTRGACSAGSDVDCGELQLSDFDRWAEPLDENLVRVLSENLSMLLSTERIERYPWRPRTKLDYQVRVDVIQLGGNAGSSLLTVRWSVLGGEEGEVLVAKKSSFRGPSASGDYGRMVQALSDALAELSREMASEIEKLGPPASG